MEEKIVFSVCVYTGIYMEGTFYFFFQECWAKCGKKLKRKNNDRKNSPLIEENGQNPFDRQIMKGMMAIDYDKTKRENNNMGYKNSKDTYDSNVKTYRDKNNQQFSFQK